MIIQYIGNEVYTITFSSGQEITITYNDIKEFFDNKTILQNKIFNTDVTTKNLYCYFNDNKKGV